MVTLPESRIAALLAPYLDAPLANETLAMVSSYLDLLLHWNARTNLTAIRAPEQLVQRQIGESLFAARFLPASGTVMDFGSGAGFPGIPMQLLCPGIVVTLAESQGKRPHFSGKPCDIWRFRRLCGQNA